jgi:hypothetical protein
MSEVNPGNGDTHMLGIERGILQDRCRADVCRNHPDAVEIPFDAQSLSPENIRPGDNLLVYRFEDKDVVELERNKPALLSVHVISVELKGENIVISCRAQYQSSESGQDPLSFPWNTIIVLSFEEGSQVMAVFPPQGSGSGDDPSRMFFSKDFSEPPLCFRIRPAETSGEVTALDVQRARRMTDCRVLMATKGYTAVDVNKLKDAAIGPGCRVVLMRFDDSDFEGTSFSKPFTPDTLAIDCKTDFSSLAGGFIISGDVKYSGQTQVNAFDGQLVFADDSLIYYLVAPNDGSTAKPEDFNPQGNKHVLCFVKKKAS